MSILPFFKKKLKKVGEVETISRDNLMIILDENEKFELVPKNSVATGFLTKLLTFYREDESILHETSHQGSLDGMDLKFQKKPAIEIKFYQEKL